MTLKRDIAYLQMAYGLAEKAKGWASPNPYVGAVIVKRDVIVGYGFHKKPGTPHAEAIALQRAGILAKNGTAYITLEPCTHWGRTPPCVDCIQKAGLKRIVISSLDPNPLVYKKGVKKLRQAGLDLDVGLLSEKNKRLNETYIKFVTQKIPFVLAKAAVSLDGDHIPRLDEFVKARGLEHGKHFGHHTRLGGVTPRIHVINLRCHFRSSFILLISCTPIFSTFYPILPEAYYP